MRVLLLHPPEGVLDARVAPGRAARELAEVIDPLDEPLRAGKAFLAAQGGRRPHALEGHERHHVCGREPGVLGRNRAPEGVRDDGRGGKAGLVQELCDVVDVVGQHVGAALDPLRIAVASQIGRDHVVVGSERFRHPVPTPAVVPAPVHEEQGRRAPIAPIDVVQAKALRIVDVGGRSMNGGCHAGLFRR